MARQIINTGTAPNDGTGDSLRVAGVKINDNFNELYTHKSTLSTVAVSGSYTDLINQPTIPADISSLTDTTGLLSQISADYSVTSNKAFTIGDIDQNILKIYAETYAASNTNMNIDSDLDVRVNAGRDVYIIADNLLTFLATTITIPGYISVTDLQTVVAASTDFADFQARVAAL